MLMQDSTDLKNSYLLTTGMRPAAAVAINWTGRDNDVENGSFFWVSFVAAGFLEANGRSISRMSAMSLKFQKLL